MCILYIDQDQAAWQCVWKANTATPVQHLAFSPDGTLFATSGENDRLVKIWYENKHCEYYFHSYNQQQQLFSKNVYCFY